MCDLCLDTLRKLPARSHSMEGKPCPACLVYPATEDVRQVAIEWLGHSAWRINLSSAWWIDQQDKVVPLHLPAGRDLAVRVLAKRLKVNTLATIREAATMDGLGALCLCCGVDPDSIPADAPAALRAGRALALCLQATEASDEG